MKKWYNSRTIQVAMLMGVSGIVTALMAEYPELQNVGIAIFLKSVIDLMLRLDTSKTIE